jgi:hypothetical protein
MATLSRSSSMIFSKRDHLPGGPGLPPGFPRRADLHCHSRASTEADEAMLQAIRCPESYSDPAEVYAQALRRQMDFVTITDHDSIAGVREILSLPNTLIGEELTCYFPEDRCKIHLLLWGITAEDHTALQQAAHDIYAVARYVEQNRLAHAVAHPLYRQNGVLDKKHIERLILLFNGFECLNGAHSTTHREVFEPLLDDLDAREIRRLERFHRIEALWPKPWQKTRTGGSDDHGLFNIGRTWTEFPDDTDSVEKLLECLRTGRCRPGGEAGSSIKLAHNFFGVGMRYYTREVAEAKDDLDCIMMRRMLGEEPPPSLFSTALTGAKLYARTIPGKLSRMLGIKKPARGTKLLGELLTSSAIHRVKSARPLIDAVKQGRAPLAEHQSMFDLVCGIDRDVSAGIFDAFSSAINNGQVGAVIDTISTVIAQQALVLPYLFALFHQNQERDLLGSLSKRSRLGSTDYPRVGLFTDTTADSDSAGKLARNLGRFAELRGLAMTLHASSSQPEPATNWRHFNPVIDEKIPAIPSGIKIPPILEVLEYADRKQFDLILLNTAGPMALCGCLVAKMLRCPVIAIFHDDLPARMLEMTGGDFRVTAALEGYISWFYRSATRVLAHDHAADKISGIQLQRLPAEETVEAIWDACTALCPVSRDEPQTTPMEVASV